MVVGRRGLLTLDLDEAEVGHATWFVAATD